MSAFELYVDVSAIFWGALVAGVCIHTSVVDVPLVLSLPGSVAAAYSVLQNRTIRLQQVKHVSGPKASG